MHTNNIFSQAGSQFGAVIASAGGLIAILGIIVSIISAIGVYLDACRLQEKDRGSVKIFSPAVWALICLCGNIPALALYWAAHHTTLSK